MAEKLSLSQAVEKLVNYYPSLQVARIRTEQAQSEIESIRSQLTWKLGGAFGVSHDVSPQFVPYDRFEAQAGLSRKLESGHSLGITGRYLYNDDDYTTSSIIPDPYESINFDINYRVPVGKGEDNIAYHQSVRIAESQKSIQQLSEKALLKSLLENVIGLFYEIDSNEKRLNFAQTSIQRSTRLKNYISKNSELGVYEKKDVLETDAQLLKVISDRENIRLALTEQKNALKRLLGLDAQSDLSLDTGVTPQLNIEQPLLSEAEQDSMDIRIREEQLKISDARIKAALNENNDQKDIVFSIGARSLYGDNATTSVSEEDYAASIRFEYNYDLGEKSYSAKIDKIKKDKDITLNELKLSKDDLKYRLSALLDKIRSQETIVTRLKQHRNVSSAKYNDAMSRYRTGRINTTDLISFENDLYLSELNLLAAENNLDKSYMLLSLVTGKLWGMLDADLANKYGKNL